jgi:hypothetical protein
LHSIPLLPRPGITLFATDGEGERFADLFRQTWRRLPLFVRRRSLKHWRGGIYPYQMVSPLIEVLPGWSRRETGRGLRGTWGFASYQGHKLQFWSKIVAAFPDALVMDLIAHEMAHVFQWACGWDLNEMDNFEVEADADWEM